MRALQFRYALIIFLVALIPRLWLFAINLDSQERWFTPDAIGYRNLGYNLLHHGAFSQAGQSPYGLDFDRTPLYPLFVAGIFAVSGDRISAVIFLQCLLSAGTCLLLYCAGSILLSGLQTRNAGAWAFAAGLAQALSLSSIAASQYLLTETLFTFLLMLQLHLALRYMFDDSMATPAGRNRSLRTLGLGTIILGLMTLCRPISLLWIIPQCFMLLWERRIRFCARLLRVGLSATIFAAVLFPWMLRNKMQDGAWFLTVNSGYTLYFHNVAALQAKRTGESAEALRQKWDEEMCRDFAERPELYDTAHARNAYQAAKARAYIRQAPWLYVRLHLQPYILLPNITAFFELIGQTQPHRGTLDVLNRQGLRAAVRHYFGERTGLIALVLPWMALLGLIYCGTVLGLAQWLAQRQWMPLLFFLAFAVYYLLLPGPVTLPRYREPAMPMLILTAAAGISRAWAYSMARLAIFARRA